MISRIGLRKLSWHWSMVVAALLLAVMSGWGVAHGLSAVLAGIGVAGILIWGFLQPLPWLSTMTLIFSLTLTYAIPTELGEATDYFEYLGVHWMLYLDMLFMAASLVKGLRDPCLRGQIIGPRALLLYVFPLWSILTAFFGISPYNSLKAGLKALLSFLFLFQFITVMRPKRALRTSLWAFYSVAMFTLILSLVLYPPALMEGDHYAGIFRMTHVDKPGVLGEACICVFASALALLVLTQGRRQRIVLVASSVLAVIIAVLSLRRTPLLAMAAALALFVWQSHRKSRQARLVMVLLIVLVLGLIVLQRSPVGYGLIARMEQRSQTARVSLETGRLDLWRANLTYVSKYPVQGAGLGNANEAVGTLPMYDTRSGAHNLLVEILAERGIVGMFIFLGLLSLAIKGVRDLETDYATAWWIVFVAVFVADMFLSGTSHTQSPLFWPLWVLLITAMWAPLAARQAEK